ncbi:MAG: hypothetical protein R2806_22680 [Saprospiraceae bacterium]
MALNKAGRRLRIFTLRGLAGIPFVISAYLFTTCNDTMQEGTQQEITATVVPVGNLTGNEALARKYCQTCHLFPEPALLDRHLGGQGTANMVPAWGLYTRIRSAEVRGSRRVVPSSIECLSGQAVDYQGGMAFIVEYYVQESPRQLPLPLRTTAASKCHRLFRPVRSKLVTKKCHRVTLLEYDPTP